jgi:DNA polymerase I-like protein with 3'-5' exonuclease and polymerase domains
MVGQFHDQIVMQVPEHRAKEAEQIIEDAMYRKIEGWPVEIFGEAKTDRDLTFANAA